MNRPTGTGSSGTPGAPRCSFCGKDAGQVRKLITGYIAPAYGEAVQAVPAEATRRGGEATR